MVTKSRKSRKCRKCGSEGWREVRSAGWRKAEGGRRKAEKINFEGRDTAKEG